MHSQKKTVHPFKILSVNHVGVVTKASFDAVNFFEKVLGLDFKGIEEINDQQTRVTVLEINPRDNSDLNSRIEILEPQGGKGPIAGFINKKGAGVHHLALTVDCIDKAIKFLVLQGVQMIDEKPRKGANQSKIAFIHPHSTGGILLELVENTC